MATRDEVISVLRHAGRLEAEQVKAVSISGGRVSITLAVGGNEQQLEQIRSKATAAVMGIAGVSDVQISMAMLMEAPAEEGEVEAGQEQAHAHGHAAGGISPISMPGVKNIIAVGAGKGGVGKSTLAVHLAVGLQRKGAKVGLFDADIYGPSLATMTGTEELPPNIVDENHILPLQHQGISIISMANFVEPDAALIWRGPMVHSVLRQLLGDVLWGQLDYLIIDLPPGTGDVPLTLAQSIGITGAVVVSTPQAVALNDAMRAAKMYEQMGIAILGLVENMSYFICDKCSAEHDIFGRGGVRAAAERLEVPFLGELPMSPAVRLNTDTAAAAKNFEGEGPVAKSLQLIVQNMVISLAKRQSLAPARPLTVE